MFLTWFSSLHLKSENDFFLSLVFILPVNSSSMFSRVLEMVSFKFELSKK